MDLVLFDMDGVLINSAKDIHESVNFALNSLGYSSKTMVGDSDIDIFAGKSANVQTCGVSYGIGNLDDLKCAKPDFLIEDFSQILNVVGKNTHDKQF
ncbi:MAG: HAD hydrolase-like protein [Clostridiales bacterium]|nr:HAD hydrolase-like protein [Clostridiales bacterium]